MSAVIDVIYENGVFKPLIAPNLKEHQQYRLILSGPSMSPSLEEMDIDPELSAQIQRRTKILPDGRTLIRLSGLFNADLRSVPEDQDPVTDALMEFRKDRANHFDEQWPESDGTVAE